MRILKNILANLKILRRLLCFHNWNYLDINVRVHPNTQLPKIFLSSQFLEVRICTKCHKCQKSVSGQKFSTIDQYESDKIYFHYRFQNGEMEYQLYDIDPRAPLDHITIEEEKSTIELLNTFGNHYSDPLNSMPQLTELMYLVYCTSLFLVLFMLVYVLI